MVIKASLSEIFRLLDLYFCVIFQLWFLDIPHIFWLAPCWEKKKKKLDSTEEFSHIQVERDSYSCLSIIISKKVTLTFFRPSAFGNAFAVFIVSRSNDYYFGWIESWISRPSTSVGARFGTIYKAFKSTGHKFGGVHHLGLMSCGFHQTHCSANLPLL